MSWIQVPNLKQILVVHFLSFYDIAHFWRKALTLPSVRESLNYDQRSIGQVKLSNKDPSIFLQINFRQSPNVLSKFISKPENNMKCIFYIYCSTCLFLWFCDWLSFLRLFSYSVIQFIFYTLQVCFKQWKLCCISTVTELVECYFHIKNGINTY